MFRAVFMPIIRSSYPYIGFGTFYAVVITVCYQFLPAPGSKWSSQLHKMYQSRCTAKNSWWWAERLPKTCRVVIPIKLEFSASVGFVHKEFVTMHGHMIIKYASNFQHSSPQLRYISITDITSGYHSRHDRKMDRSWKMFCKFAILINSTLFQLHFIIKLL